MAGRSALLAAGMLLGLVSGGRVFAEMDGSASLLEAIESAARLRVAEAGADDVARALGVAFVRSEELSNEYFEVLTSGASTRFKAIAAVEARRPISGGAKNGGLLIVTLDSHALCISDAEVRERYGQTPELSVPTPRQPPKSPIHLVYNYEWGALRIGISRDEPACVTDLIFDYAV